jgi:isoquinoline 1-oxidoreductase beta subunit
MTAPRGSRPKGARGGWQGGPSPYGGCEPLFRHPPSRRQVLVAAGGLVIGFTLPIKRRPFLLDAAAAEHAKMSAFLRIAPDDTVTVLLPHSEMGQGIWTSLPMLIAEELEADWSKVRVEHAPAAPAYFHTVWGQQGTGGSTSTWTEFDRMRKVGAVARDMLVRAAAQRWKVDAKTLRAENGAVVGHNQRAPFGSLVAAAAKLAPAHEVPLKDPKDWKIIGKPHKRLDGPEKVTGRAVFGIDVGQPGLKVAQVTRSPVFGGKVKAFRGEAALAIPGVKKVLQVPTGVAVVADNFWAASRGREALKIDWELGTGASIDTTQIEKDLRALVKKPGRVAVEKGDVGAALARAKKRIEAEYDVPYLAHAPMEPLNATVHIQPDRCDVWTGTQSQTNDQKAAAEITGLPSEKVFIHTTFLGGGFGRRANPKSDFVSEAVHVAKAAGGPVKTVWTREDDMAGGWYRPMFVHRIEAGLDGVGALVAWRHTIAGQALFRGTGLDRSALEGVSDSPYLTGIGARLVTLHSPDIGVPVLWWRSVGHTHTAFAMETFIDEVAHATKHDPVDFRRTLLKDAPRRLRVLEAAAEKASWGKRLPSGIGRGVAVHESFGGFVAQVAEVSVEKGKIQVHRVVCAIDCGTVVNPDGVVAQMQSGVAYGLTAALYGRIGIKEGRVQETNFDDYRVVRLNNMPPVEVVIAPGGGKMGGAGEPATPPIAPAVGNAVFALTGKRLRSLPFKIG